MKLNRVVPIVAATVLAWAGTSQALVVIDPFTTTANVNHTLVNATSPSYIGFYETDTGPFVPFDQDRVARPELIFSSSAGTTPWTTTEKVTIGGGSATFEISRTGNGTKVVRGQASAVDYSHLTGLNLTGLTLSFDVTASSQSGTWAANFVVYDNAGFVVTLSDNSVLGTFSEYVVGGTPNVLPTVGSYSIALDNVNFPGIDFTVVDLISISLVNAVNSSDAYSGSVTIQNLAIIPEPTTALMVSLAGAALVVFGRRRGARA